MITDNSLSLITQGFFLLNERNELLIIDRFGITEP